MEESTDTEDQPFSRCRHRGAEWNSPEGSFQEGMGASRGMLRTAVLQEGRNGRKTKQRVTLQSQGLFDPLVQAPRVRGHPGAREIKQRREQLNLQRWGGCEFRVTR